MDAAELWRVLDAISEAKTADDLSEIGKVVWELHQNGDMDDGQFQRVVEFGQSKRRVIETTHLRDTTRLN